MRSYEWLQELIRNVGPRRRRRQAWHADSLVPRLSIKRLEERRVLNADAAPVEVLLVDAGDAANDGAADTFQVEQDAHSLRVLVNGQEAYSGNGDVSAIHIVGSADNDVLVADLLAGVELTFDGAGGEDTLQLNGQPEAGSEYDSIDYNFGGGQGDRVEATIGDRIAGVTLHNVEKVHDSVAASERSFTITGPAQEATLSADDQSAGTTRLTLGGEDALEVAFANPSDSLLIDTSSASDAADEANHIQLDSLGSGFDADLAVIGSSQDSFAIGSDVELGSVNLGTGDLYVSTGSIVLSGDIASEEATFELNAESSIEVGSEASLTNRGGQISLDSGDSGTTTLSGRIDVSDSAIGESGGVVHLLGGTVGVLEGAEIDASGDAGGGVILIGGALAGSDPLIRNAQHTVVESNTRVRADAITTGSGGRIIVWADLTTRVDGALWARGGAESGDGGFIETSGLRDLDFGGTVVASATNGAAGTWLLDPTDITIDAVATTAGITTGIVAGTQTFADDPGDAIPALTAASVNVATIIATLQLGTNVTVTTTSTGGGDGDITVDADILVDLSLSLGAQAPTLTLNADRDIIVNNTIAVSGTDVAGDQLNVVMNAGRDIDINAAITTDGGAFTATGGRDLDNTGGAITTGGGAVEIDLVRDAIIDANIDSGGGQVDIVVEDFDLNANLDAGAGDVTITATPGIGFRLGGNPTGGFLSLSGTELQAITADNLTLSTAGDIVVRSISAANSDNIAGTLTLNATGADSEVDFQIDATFNTLEVNATNRIEISNNVDIATDTGGITLDSDSDADGDGDLVFGNANSTLMTPDQAIVITANDIDLNGTIDSGLAATTINDSDGDGIALGAATVADGLELTDTELGQITAAALTFNTAGSIAVEDATNLGATSTLMATGDIDIVDSDGLQLAAIDAMGDVTVTVTGGDVSTTAGADITGENITITLEPDFTLSVDADTSITAVTNTTLVADKMTLASAGGDLISAGAAGTLAIQAAANGTNLVLGANAGADDDTAPGTLALDATDLAALDPASGTIQFGADASRGATTFDNGGAALTINAPLSFFVTTLGFAAAGDAVASDATITIDATGAITDFAGDDTTTDITATTLTIVTATTIGVTQTDALNLSVDTLNVLGSDGDAFFTEANGVDLGTVNVSTDDDLFINAIAGDITDANDDSEVVANNLTLHARSAGAAIGASGAATDINVELDGALTALADNGAGGVFLSELGDMALSLVNAGTGNAELIATMAITDATAGEGAGNENILAATATLTAAEGIGSGTGALDEADDLDTNVATLVANNTTSGAIQIRETNNLSLGSITNMGRDVVLDAGGEITDGNLLAVNVTAEDAILRAANLIGVAANPIDTDIASLQASTTNSTPAASGGVFVLELDTLTADGLTIAGAGVTTANVTTPGVSSGAINLATATGDIEVATGATVRTGDAILVDAAGATAAITGGITLTSAAGITGAGVVATGNAQVDATTNDASDTATSGSITLTADDDVALGGVDALTIGAATVLNLTLDDSAATGDITITSADRINNGTVGSGLDVSFGAASGGVTNTAGMLSATTDGGAGAAGEIQFASDSAVVLGTLNTANGTAQNVAITVSGGAALTVAGISDLDSDNVVLTTDVIDVQDAGADLALGATLSAEFITVQPSTAATPINLGSEVAGSLSLTDPELDELAATTLQIGSSSAGSITISEDLTPANITNLALASGGTLTQEAGDTVTVAGLGLAITGNTTLDQANNVTTLAADNDGSTFYREANSVIIGAIAGPTGTITGVTTSSGDITVDVDAGTLTISNVVTAAAAGNVTLNADANATLINAAVSSTTGNIDVDGTAISQTANVTTGGTGTINVDAATAAIIMSGVATTSTGSGAITYTAATNVALTQLSTTGAIDVTATAGAITDNSAGEAANLVNGAATLTAATGIGSLLGDIDTSIASLQATNTTSGGIFVQEANGLTVNGAGVRTLGGNGPINIDVNAAGLTLDGVVTAHGSGSVTLNADAGTVDINAVVSSTTGAIDIDGSAVTQDANVVTTGVGTINVDANVTAITMADGTTATTGSGAINYTASTNVALSQIQTVGAIFVTATTGAISDNTAAEGANLVDGVVTLNAATGIGVADDINTSVSFLQATNNTSGAINLQEANGLIIFGTGVRTLGGNGAILVDVNLGDLTNSSVVTAHGSGGVTLNADAGTVAINAVVSSSTGAIDIDGNAVAQVANITSGGAGTINVDADVTSIVMTDGALAMTGSGAISYTAASQVALSQLQTSGAIGVTATAGAITDNTALEGANLVNGAATLTAAMGIGVAGVGDIDTSIASLQATNTTDGEIVIQEANGLIVTGTGVRTLDIDNDDLSNTTAGDISLDVLAGDLTTNGAVTAARDGDVRLNSAAGTVALNAAVESTTGGVNVTGAGVTQGAGGDVTTGDSGGEVGAVTVTATSTNITMGDGSSATAGTGAIIYTAANNVSLSLLSNSGMVDVTATAGTISDNTAAEDANIVGNMAALRAGAGIGASAAGGEINTTLANLEGAGGSGGAFVQNTTALTIGAVDAGLTGLSANGDVEVATLAGDLTVAEAVASNLASATLAAGSNLQVNATVTGSQNVTGTATADINVLAVVTATNQTVMLDAGNDALLGAAVTGGANVNATTGGDLTTNAVVTATTQSVTLGAGNNATLNAAVNGNMNVNVAATGDLTTAAAATVTASTQAVALGAGNNALINGNVTAGSTVAVSAGAAGATTPLETLQALTISPAATITSSLGSVTGRILNIEISGSGPRYGALDLSKIPFPQSLTTGSLGTITITIDDTNLGTNIPIQIDWRESNGNISTAAPFVQDTAPRPEIELDQIVEATIPADTATNFTHIYFDNPDGPTADFVFVPVRIAALPGITFSIAGDDVISILQEPGTLGGNLDPSVNFQDIGGVNAQMGIVTIVALDVQEFLIAIPDLLADPLPTAAPVAPLVTPAAVPTVLVSIPNVEAPNSSTPGATTQSEDRYYELRIVSFDQDGKLVETAEERINLSDDRLKAIAPFNPSKLPELFQRLPGDRYRIYLMEDGSERLMIEFVIEQVGDEGRPIELPERIEVDPQAGFAPEDDPTADATPVDHSPLPVALPARIPTIVSPPAKDLSITEPPTNNATAAQYDFAEQLGKASFVSSGGLMFGAAMLSKRSRRQRQEQVDRRMAGFRSRRRVNRNGANVHQPHSSTTPRF